MDHLTSKKSSTKISVVGIFAVITFILTLPIALLLSQERQELRGKAAEPTPTPALIVQTNEPRVIAGYVYFDSNRNGERDPGEKSYPNVAIKITQATEAPNQEVNPQDVATLTTDANGYFKISLSNLPPTVSLMIKLVLPDGYKTINTNPIIISTLQTEAKENIEFGLFPLVINK